MMGPFRRRLEKARNRATWIADRWQLGVAGNHRPKSAS
jgi:hypothetical protein